MGYSGLEGKVGKPLKIPALISRIEISIEVTEQTGSIGSSKATVSTSPKQMKLTMTSQPSSATKQSCAGLFTSNQLEAKGMNLRYIPPVVMQEGKVAQLPK